MPDLLDGEPDFPVVRLPPSAAVSSKAAVGFLVRHLASLGHLRPADATLVASQILHREALGSTGVGRGVAIPHARSEAVTGMAGLLAVSAKGIPWPGALDGQSVRVVCLFVTHASDPAASLRAVGAVSARLRRLRGIDGEGDGPGG